MTKYRKLFDPTAAKSAPGTNAAAGDHIAVNRWLTRSGPAGSSWNATPYSRVTASRRPVGANATA
ncbi:MAG: hypothetical protein C0501_05830 [Isosphaera sp.]|nr:hypothetical protein [Isosphaera sp.]